MEPESALGQIKEKVVDGKIQWRGHATYRLIERKISRDDVIQALLSGEIIEFYPTDKPYPSFLILGQTTEKIALHVVCALSEDAIWIITVYFPDKDKWENNFKTRKR